MVHGRCPGVAVVGCRPDIALDVACSCTGRCGGMLFWTLQSMSGRSAASSPNYTTWRHFLPARTTSTSCAARPRSAPTVQPLSSCSLSTPVPLQMCCADARASPSAGVIRSRRRRGPVRPRCIGRQHDFASNACHSACAATSLRLFRACRSFRIFCVLGTITDANWRGAVDLPDFQSRIRPPAPAQRVLHGAVRFGTRPTSTAMAAHPTHLNLINRNSINPTHARANARANACTYARSNARAHSPSRGLAFRVHAI